jgi:hypothetical protein
MKLTFAFLFATIIITSCHSNQPTTESTNAGLPIEGTWKLLSGTLIEKGDTTITDYTKKLSFIKIINASHFAFLNHDLDKGKDSATASFVAGGGRYTLEDSVYTEHLEYCNDRQWEGNDFTFTISIKNDTLVQTGVEKVESAGVNRLNIEKYVRMKD